jgi:hypothetical protein
MPASLHDKHYLLSCYVCLLTRHTPYHLSCLPASLHDKHYLFTRHTLPPIMLCLSAHMTNTLPPLMLCLPLYTTYTTSYHVMPVCSHDTHLTTSHVTPVYSHDIHPITSSHVMPASLQDKHYLLSCYVCLFTRYIPTTSHTTHALEPLARVVFKPIKTCCHHEATNLMHNHPNAIITKYHF